MQIKTVLIANRGEIAVRIARVARDLGIKSIAIYSEADAGALHTQVADEAYALPGNTAADTYMNVPALLDIAVRAGADAIHPGYGFLSENADFARALDAAGIVFVGPPVASLDAMADKIRAKETVAAYDVPVVPGIQDPTLTDAQITAEAEHVGFPLLIKPSAGGGGKGMVAVRAAEELPGALASARRTARSAFGDDTLLLERLITAPRHIEVQVFADAHGATVHLGERECSLQRRHQKVIEEAPAPLLTGLAHGAELRERLGRAAVDAANPGVPCVRPVAAGGRRREAHVDPLRRFVRGRGSPVVLALGAPTERTLHALRHADCWPVRQSECTTDRE